jgi:hypothetical protein
MGSQFVPSAVQESYEVSLVVASSMAVQEEHAFREAVVVVDDELAVSWDFLAFVKRHKMQATVLVLGTTTITEARVSFFLFLCCCFCCFCCFFFGFFFGFFLDRPCQLMLLLLLLFLLTVSIVIATTSRLAMTVVAQPMRSVVLLPLFV